jgi:EmrB/QacA subfamily drug resistance transporter
MGRVMSVIGVPMLLGPILGPIIGGAIVGAASWRWIFFVNLPVGLAAVVLAWRRLPETPPRGRTRLDLAGLALLSPGLAAFVYGMSEVGANGGLRSARTLAAVAVGVALVALFVLHALRRGGAALIDVSLFRRPGFAAAAATTLLVGIALFGALILLPLYYGIVRGESPLATGILLVPQGVGAALAMPFAGRWTDEVGARVVVSSGILLALAGTAAFTQVGAGTPYVVLAGALLVIGLGLGATIVPSMAVAYQSVPPAAVPAATSAINVTQRVAGSVGTALLAVVLQHSIATSLPGLAGGIGAVAALPPPARVEAAPVLADAFATAFWVALALVAAALVPALMLPRPAPRTRQGSAAAGAPS